MSEMPMAASANTNRETDVGTQNLRKPKDHLCSEHFRGYHLLPKRA